MPGEQVVSQTPQCVGSELVSTQPPAQFVSGVEHAAVQTPCEQTSVAEQPWPQVPQLWGSLVRLAHALPAQADNGAEQEQTPLTHTAPFAHRVAQAPQCAESEKRSTHAP
jgi:hypothetical protein